MQIEDSVLTTDRNPALSKQNISTVYVPAVLLIIGVGLVKKEWIPFAALLAAAAGGLKIYTTSTWCTRFNRVFANVYASSATQVPQARHVPKPPSHADNEDLPQHKNIQILLALSQPSAGSPHWAAHHYCRDTKER